MSLVKCVCFLGLFLFFSCVLQAQHDSVSGRGKISGGLDFYNLNCGDTMMDYFIKNGHPRFNSTQYAAESFGISIHGNYVLNKFLMLRCRLGWLNSAELDFSSQLDRTDSSYYDRGRDMVSHQTRFFISPGVVFQKKINWLSVRAKLEIPVFFYDRRTVTISYFDERYDDGNKNHLLGKVNSNDRYRYSNGISWAPSLGAGGAIFISKKIEMEILMSWYYMMYSAKVKVVHTGDAAGKILTPSGYMDIGSYTDTANSYGFKSALLSKPSVSISFSYFFIRK